MSLVPAAPIHVEVIDFARNPDLLREAADYYCSLEAERQEWTDEKRKRIVIRTTCRWGRVTEGDSVFMLNEMGEGPKAPLSSENKCKVQLYAELRESAPKARDGYIEQKPFAAVTFDDATARQLHSAGLVRLSEFISSQVANYVSALQEWEQILLSARQRIHTFRQQKAAVKKAPVQIEEQGQGPSAGV